MIVDCTLACMKGELDLGQVATSQGAMETPADRHVGLGMQNQIRTCTSGMTPQVVVAYGKLKWFCNELVLKLAPLLLMEVQLSLRPEAEPFTPRRTTRGSKRAPTSKACKATQAESVLMRGLGIVPEDLDGNEENIAELAEIFDSPLREQHIRVIVALFGKEVPPARDLAVGSSTVLGAA